MTMLTAIVIPALAMLALHWFPWRFVIGRELHRLEAYMIGVGVFMVSATGVIYLGNVQERDAAVLIYWLSAASAGIATLIAWAVDGSMEHIHSLKDKVHEAELGYRDDQD